VTFGEVKGVTKSHDLSEEIWTVTKTLEYSRHQLAAGPGSPLLIDLGNLIVGLGIFDQGDLALDELFHQGFIILLHWQSSLRLPSMVEKPDSSIRIVFLGAPIEYPSRRVECARRSDRRVYSNPSGEATVIEGLSRKDARAEDQSWLFAAISILINSCGDGFTSCYLHLFDFVHSSKTLMRILACTGLLFASLLTPLICGAQQDIDLRTALSTAEMSNLELRAARQQRAIALAGLTTARQVPNPVASFTAARDTPHEGVSLDLPLELAGQRGKRIAVAREEQKSTDLDISILSRQVRRRTREAFFKTLAARAQTLQAKTALDLSSRIFDLVQQRFQAGDVAQLEVLQAEVELARSNADYETTAQAELAADVTLAALLNRKIGERLPVAGHLEEIPVAPALETVLAEAMRSGADILKTSQDLTTEERRLVLARSQRVPNLDLSVGADFNSPPDFRTGAKGGLAMTLPLFYRGQGEIALSNTRLELLRLTLQSQRINVSALVSSSYFDHAAKSHQAQQYRDKIVPQTVRIEAMAEDSYKSGKTNILTLLDSQRRLNDVQKAYIDSLLAAQTSFAALEESVGVSLD
jgi:outer membrane protein, heavy metal efflux system